MRRCDGAQRRNSTAATKLGHYQLRACFRRTLDYSSRSLFQGKTSWLKTIDFMAAAANDLRRGMAIDYNGDICVVLDVQHRTPGNLRAFVQATLRSIRTGKSSDVRFSSTEKVETVPMMT